jgi:ATP-binding cassette subfamily B protein
MESLNELLSTPVQKQPKKASRVGPLKSIAFDHVSFSYASANRPALKDISLQINKGQTVAFAGASGSGKSTVVKLLLGLYTPTAGKVLINGIDARRIDYNDLRNRIGFVTQDTQLFAGTIRDNLLFASPGASDEECLVALRGAAIIHVIERTGQGLDTRIGEGGIKLSGGERQRIAIARALLRKPELLIFDEATSSLDSLAEREITKTISDIMRHQPNLMIILIAHRLSTITRAQYIYVLELGKITETGPHDALLDKKGLYYAFWRQQRGEASAPA